MVLSRLGLLQNDVPKRGVLSLSLLRKQRAYCVYWFPSLSPNEEKEFQAGVLVKLLSEFAERQLSALN